ncbi:MAG: AAA domain-containing protein [Candidatus Magasanikbacteria bacterium]|jgi:energy-coupling factor transporter ATP-binding protein EcfA2|nr:AAA domain-containing protein [Candidatus Magasanikbacteria bacterium]
MAGFLFTIHNAIKKEHAMADLLRITAKNHPAGKGIVWESTDSQFLKTKIKLDTQPTEEICEGDVWQVQFLDKTDSKPSSPSVVTFRLVAKVRELKTWQKITTLEDFWTDPDDLQDILCWVNEGQDIILIGEAGSGKTTLPFALARALGWQEPYKVDVAMMKKAQDFFGKGGAADGKAFFAESPMMQYIRRAQIAYDNGIESHFVIILDELNRVHAHTGDGLHGLFDDTRQISIPTSEGGLVIKLPPNIHFFGTINQGGSYVGTFQMDQALKSRFAPIYVPAMPRDVEVRKLTKEVGVTEKEAGHIVDTARKLREACGAGQLEFAPDYRVCRSTAYLIKNGRPLRRSLIKGLLGWYNGRFELDHRGEIMDPNSELAKAYSAIRAIMAK